MPELVIVLARVQLSVPFGPRERALLPLGALPLIRHLLLHDEILNNTN